MKCLRCNIEMLQLNQWKLSGYVPNWGWLDCRLTTKVHRSVLCFTKEKDLSVGLTPYMCPACGCIEVRANNREGIISVEESRNAV